jgi:hypothetical protein
MPVQPITGKEQFMKNYIFFALPAAFACLVGTGLLGVLTLLVAVAHSLMPTAVQPFLYYQYLNLPILSVALPVIGMALLAPIALHLAFAREEPVQSTVEIEEKAAMLEPEERFLKAA